MARIKDRERERLWTQRLRQHAASGLSVTQFCARAGVACSAFYYWKRRLAAEPQPLPARPPLFVPLHVDLPAPEDHAQDAARGVEIVLPHQVRLRLDSLPEPEWITRLVTALAGLPPQEAAR